MGGNPLKTTPNPLPETIQRLVLIGFRGTGKTTLAQQLAGALQWPVFSTDRRVEMQAKMPIHRLIAEKGWEKFRALESRIIAELPADQPAIIDCGGGVIEAPQNLRYLAQNALVVWVDADEATIYRRLLAAGDRPLLSQPNLREDIAANYRRREPLYRQHSHLRVDTAAESIAAICHRIVDMIHHRTS